MGKSKYVRFIRFKEHLFPAFQNRVGSDMVELNEDGRLMAVFKRNEKGIRKMWMHYYPIGNLVCLNNGSWIRDKAIDYVFEEVFGMPMPELREILYPDGDPVVKNPSKKQSRVAIEVKVEKLSIVGNKFQHELDNKKTWAHQKMIKSLEDAGIPFLSDFMVVVKRAGDFKLEPKMYFLDLYIPPPFNFSIEVDGEYHSTPEQMKKDKIKAASVKGKGFGETIRIKNEQVMQKDLDVMKFLNQFDAFKVAVASARRQRAKQDF